MKFRNSTVVMVLIFAIFSCLPGFSEAASYRMCDDVEVHGKKIELNGNESILVCGTEKGESWERIPLLQKQQQIQILLQSKGYPFTQFKIENETLFVDTGELAKATSLVFKNHPDEIKPERKRKVIRQPLDSGLLDEVEGWAKSELGHYGYPCHKVSSTAFLPDKGIQVTIDSGPKQIVKNVIRDGLIDLDEEVIIREQAFKEGDVFDARLLELTNQRLLRDGLVQSSYFTHSCTPEGAELHHHLAIGKPNILQAGIGASSEELPFIDITWKNLRIDRYASNLGVTGHFSRREQTVKFFSDYYIFKFSKRAFFSPHVEFQRNYETNFEILAARAGTDLGYTHEFKYWRALIKAGPTLNYQNTVSGEGPDDLKYLTWDVKLSMFEHDYEFFQVRQIDGTTLNLDLSTQRKGLGAPLNSHLVHLKGKWLHNVNQYSPPLFVTAVRWDVASTITKEELVPNSPTNLPKEYRHFLGGVENLRGYSRKSISNGGVGYLTSVYLGFETRLIETVPYHIEPLILFDYAKVGRNVATLGPTTFTSTGAGIRWMSPFGPLRGVAAYGKTFQREKSADETPDQWMFTASFGQEF